MSHTPEAYYDVRLREIRKQVRFLLWLTDQLIKECAPEAEKFRSDQ